jgi:flagellar basal body rod protein FlgC
MSTEMADMVYVTRVYQANITAFNSTKKMISDTLQIQ